MTGAIGPTGATLAIQIATNQVGGILMADSSLNVFDLSGAIYTTHAVSGYSLNIGATTNLGSGGIITPNLIPTTITDMNYSIGKDGQYLVSTGAGIEWSNQLVSNTPINIPYPKSLANSFGMETVLPLLQQKNISVADALCTYTEHVAVQVGNSMDQLNPTHSPVKLLVTGGGALNTFLLQRLGYLLENKGVELCIPDENIIQYKEALIMAFMGVLRWREEANVLSSVTGARKSSIGGALWMTTS